MRFLIIVKAAQESESGSLPDDALIAKLADYHEELARAGVLLDAAGLKPSSEAWRILYEGATRTIVDGPFREDADLIAGYTLIQARSRDEALEWTRRFPNPRGEGLPAQIEVRPLLGLEDLSGSDAIRRFRAPDHGNAND